MNRSNIKILFFCNVDWFLLSHRANLLRNAIKLGFEVHVVCLVTQDMSKLEHLGVTIHPINLRREGMGIINFTSNLLYFYKIMKKIQPDILHCITSKPNLIGGIVSLITPVPRVVLAISGFGIIAKQDNWLAFMRNRIVFSLYRYISNRPYISLLTQNRDDYEACTKLTKHKEQVHLIMGSGVDLEFYRPNDYSLKFNNTPKILFASRLLKSKGINVFLGIAEKKQYLMEKLGFDDIHFWVAGKFDKANPESIDITDLNYFIDKGFISYKGNVENVSDLLNEASILVLPTSYGEGLPKIICEAACCGVPVLASNIAGCRQGVVDNITGNLVAKIGVKEFSEKLIEMLSDLCKLQQMSIDARKYAELNFDEKTITEQHFTIYKSG